MDRCWINNVSQGIQQTLAFLLDGDHASTEETRKTMSCNHPVLVNTRSRRNRAGNGVWCCYLVRAGAMSLEQASDSDGAHKEANKLDTSRLLFVSSYTDKTLNLVW